MIFCLIIYDSVEGRYLIDALSIADEKVFIEEALNVGVKIINSSLQENFSLTLEMDLLFQKMQEGNLKVYDHKSIFTYVSYLLGFMALLRTVIGFYGLWKKKEASR